MTDRRFLQRIRKYHPGRELVTEARICPNRDPYLKDYLVDGQCQVPDVMVMEAISQVARVLVARQPQSRVNPLGGDLRLDSIESLSVDKRLTVNSQGCVLRCHATLLQPHRVKVWLQSSESQFQQHHVTAICCFNTSPLCP